MIIVDSYQIKEGFLTVYDNVGIGIELGRNKNKYSFREEAVYSCVVDASKMISDEVWL